MSYSLWLQPQETDVRNYVSGLVGDLAKKYSGPEFEPHSTLLGDLQFSLDEMKPLCEKLVRLVEPFTVDTGTVEYSTTYYQCLFVRLKPNPKLMELYTSTKQVFGQSQPSVFMPHISLFYGDISYAKRDEIMKSVVFEPQHFTVSSLVVTPGGEHPPSEWQHVLELPFSKN